MRKEAQKQPKQTLYFIPDHVETHLSCQYLRDFVQISLHIPMGKDVERVFLRVFFRVFFAHPYGERRRKFRVCA